MFDRIYNWIIRRVVRMRKRDLQIDKYDNSKDVDRWTSIYEGRAPWVNLNPNKEEGEKYVTAELNTGAKIAAEMARLTTIEFQSEITGEDAEEFVDDNYQRVLEGLRVNVEYALAKGGMVMRPYHNPSTKEILVEFIQNGEFIPLKFDDSGRMTSVCFTESVERDDVIYTKIETHKWKHTGDYIIENRAWKIEGAGFTKASSRALDVVEEWAGLPEETILTDVKAPLFGYFKPPFADNVKGEQELGVSIFARVEQLMQRLDKQHSLMIHEYEVRRSKIFIDKAYTQGLSLNEQQKYLHSDVYEILDGTAAAMNDKDYIFKVYGPDIRNKSINEEINRLSRAIESSVGLSFGFLSDTNDKEMTATEIISSKQRSYSTVKDIQKSLQSALDDLVYAMVYIEAAYGLSDGSSGRKPSEDYQVNYDWDDSIIVDKKEKLEEIKSGIDKGYLHPKYYLMEKLGMTEEQALEELEELKKYKDSQA